MRYRVELRKKIGGKTIEATRVAGVMFSNWEGAVSYACPFVKSPSYDVKIYNEKGERVSYYSNG